MRKIEVRIRNPVIALSGEIDMSTTDTMVAALEPSVWAGGPLTLDVSEVTFMDSTALHALVTASRALGERGCIIVHGAHGAVWTLLQMTKVDEALENMHFIPCRVLDPAA